jgi:plasmid stability protein
MTVVFDDEKLYKAVKVEAARSGRHAKDIVAEALKQWLEEQEEFQDEELLAELEKIRKEWREKGAIEAGEFFRSLKKAAKR